MYRAWYRKWRPMDFDGVCGQDHITEILKYQVSSKKTSHAYLFCGSRGTGKTSCAKILARAVNCESPINGNPCNQCYACQSVLKGVSTDVIEIDAASNNGVDHVRDIKEEVNFTPAELDYRVYIIDEVHMMSPSAFNALLKTLEEPPSHVIFILATTELQKLPSTIISRCQRYDFRRMPTSVLVDRMKTISQEEGIELTDDGALVIARMAQGGMRDAVSLLELCAGAHQKIDDLLATEVLGAGSRNDILRLIRAIADKKYEDIYDILGDVVRSSRDIAVFWQDLMDTYRNLSVVKTANCAKEYLDLTDFEFSALDELAEKFSMTTLLYQFKILEDTYLAMQRSASVKRVCAEMALLRLCEPRLSGNMDSVQARISKLEENIGLLQIGIVPAESKAKSESVEEKENIPSEAKEESNTSDTPPSAPESTTPNSAESAPKKDTYRAVGGWGAIIEQMSEQNGAISAFLQGSRLYASADSYILKLTTGFAVKMISRPEVLEKLKNLISVREGKNISLYPFSVVTEKEAVGVDLCDEIASALKN